MTSIIQPSSSSANNSNNNNNRRSSLAATRGLTEREQEEISSAEWKQLMAEFGVFLFALLGIIFNGMGVSSCRVLNLQGGIFNNGGYGLFYLQLPDTSECQGIVSYSEVTSERYPDHIWDPNQDEVLAFAQVGGIISLILGFILIVNITIRQFCKEVKYYKLILFLTATGIQVTLGWTHLIWWTKGCDFFTCRLGNGLTFFIVSHACWLLASVLTTCMRPSKQERKSRAMSVYTSQLRLTIRERENRYEMEYLPVAASILVMGLFIYLALHNINEK